MIRARSSTLGRAAALVTMTATGLAPILAPSLAMAAEPVIVTPAVTEGELGDAARERLESRLREAVRKSDLELVDVDATIAAEASTCADDGCRATLLGDHGGRFLLVPSIAIDDQDYTLRLSLYGPRGQQLATLEESCGLCGLAEAEDVLADLGARIGRKVELASRASALEVTSDPAGARVYVGDELVGTTPFELPLEAGAHPLRIELDGYIGQQRTVEVVAGENQTLAFGLQPVPVDTPEPRPRAKLLAGLGWTSLVVGVGAAAGGATLIALEERPITSDCSGDNVDAEGNCRWRYATLEPGIGLVAGGAVLIGTAVALLVVARKPGKSRETPTQARVRVLPSATGIALSF